MTDIHSHVLPGMDDGSRSVEESLAMLSAAAAQGIDRIACTSHFYPDENSPRRYLERRAQSLELLRPALPPDAPELLPGAEVYYFDGLSRNDDVPALRIEGTQLLLLEMPFGAWSERMIEEVWRLNERRGVTVVLAHIERYFHWNRPAIFERLRGRGVLMQCNASFFLGRLSSLKAKSMLRRGEIDFIASDCHNTSSRPQQLGMALERLNEGDRARLMQTEREHIAYATV